jgi:hypothetical protein
VTERKVCPLRVVEYHDRLMVGPKEANRFLMVAMSGNRKERSSRKVTNEGVHGALIGPPLGLRNAR